MSKALVAYFSTGGKTKLLAEKLAEAVDGDLHEIIPQKKYTEADLDWMDKSSRASVEMNDKSFRPPVANKVADIQKYDVIYVGFPIWWYVAPSIINTFLESYNLAGKTVVPFVTSGSCQYDKASDSFKNSCKGAKLMPGKRFTQVTTVSDLKEWVEELHI